MFARLATGLSLAALLAGAVEAQQFDRRARDEPEVVIEAGGRVGTADVVRFTPDGNFLLAAGDDKVARSWPHSASTGLDTAPDAAKVLRWRGWRDQLGGIKCLATSANGKRVAVGGYGLKISSIAVLDRETGETVGVTWPRVREGAYHDAVTAIAFHPDGRRVGFGTADGTLWFWEPKKLDAPEGDRLWNAPACAGRFTNPAPDQLNFTRNIRFPDADTMLAVSSHGQVLACDLKGKLTDDPAAAAPEGRTVFEVFAGQPERYRVHAAEWTGDGKWLVAATTGPLVLLRSADGKGTRRVELPTDHFARSFAVHPKTGRVAVGVGSALPAGEKKPRFYMEPDDQLWLYADPLAEKVAAPKKLKFAGRAEAMGFHPTLDRLAIAGGDADEVTLLDLATPEKPLSVVRGGGRRLYAVNLSESGEVIAVKTGRNPAATDPNDRGTGPWLRFNVPRFAFAPNDRGTWLGPVRTAGGWEVVPDEASRFVWHAERKKPDGTAERLRLVLDVDLDQAPTCYTFVPTAEGKPARVVVGHYYGCSLFELDPARAVKNPRTGALELQRAKLFIGHGAEVNAVAADKTGEWFVTAGADQTVAAWSLEDWKSQAALGAAFGVDGGNLVVRAVDAGSPAWEAGLTAGDRIEVLAVGGKAVFDRRPKRAEVGTAAAAAALLAEPLSGVELFFGWVTDKGERRATPTRLKQRPLWKWFPAFDERGRLTDSVLWMWHGSYYYTASAHGDRVLGWHVNAPDVAGTPEFQPLERYKHLFLRPDVITKLVATRSVAAALKEATGDNPRKRSFREVEPPPVELALQSGTVREDGVKLGVAVNPRGNDPDLLPERVELWVNDFRLRTWPGRGKEAFREDVVIPAGAFRAGDNKVTVVALNAARGRAEAGGVVRNPAKAAEPNLVGLAVGINDYAAHRTAVAGARSLGDLGKASADATGVRKALLNYRGDGKFFKNGEVAAVLEEAADRKGILAALADLKKAAVRPDDLLVVFFAGHGDLLLPGGGPPDAAPKELAARGLARDAGLFVLCCPDYAPARPGATAVSCDELFEALAGVNCRKLVLLDACHSGGAAGANVLRRLVPNGQGPTVIASCDQGELAFEDDALGHGVFTYAVLEALGPRFRTADADSDGTVSTAELYGYLAERVPALVREVRPGSAQNPICFPRPTDLPRAALLRK
ncbi:peptidase c14 caspase catalytic subunit p20 : WD-40 repeat OS=Microscilla marina ATCC 23134 GN=M23134_00154 PE=4 SV=1: WD40: WD40: Peptidase_C14 [Gemmataceae bacterium]|nr:peptidase c14 caspase catalytic subunit p20 : WD-40 repeat OS=Microscilla marina ATCC 23134 GN=M23134_00154 PE=4 SV=1: WD40: WD40: Peptidase_C14 [Gemmataceae bacterium]VTT97504.1 peptidase c14 caspase catalytic subunit p20 : WD-40 repeat OS=Microscilla marina ATCC 23134 GN=M23134_00154 PE=4 SV=1: WD40: WD40: Peptidase_C14 [Gemmataceae bacterium]